LTTAVSLRSAWDMRRACRPMCESPISPSISAFGTSAATESITTRSTAPDRTNVSAISNVGAVCRCSGALQRHGPAPVRGGSAEAAPPDAAVGAEQRGNSSLDVQPEPDYVFLPFLTPRPPRGIAPKIGLW